MLDFHQFQGHESRKTVGGGNGVHSPAADSQTPFIISPVARCGGMGHNGTMQGCFGSFDDNNNNIQQIGIHLLE